MVSRVAGGRSEVHDQVGADRGPAAVEVDNRVGDEVLGRLVGLVVPAGLGDEGLSSLGRAARCPDCCFLDEERSHFVEAAVVQERSKAVDEVGDLGAVGELPYLTVEARRESGFVHGLSFIGNGGGRVCWPRGQ
jgi:hypothetical protein